MWHYRNLFDTPEPKGAEKNEIVHLLWLEIKGKQCEEIKTLEFVESERIERAFYARKWIQITFIVCVDLTQSINE